MASPMLPYYCPPAELPVPLPSREEIEASQTVLVDQSAHKVVVVGDHFVVKYGIAIELIEGENLLFVHKANCIRVPRVYAIYTDVTDNTNFIVMAKEEGEVLLALWPSLMEEDKAAIAAVVRTGLDKLRNLPSPGGYCSIDRRPLLDGIFWNGNSKDIERINGPFDTEDDLNEAMIKKYKFDNVSPHKAEFYKRSFPVILKDHPPTFTHGDLQRKNMIVRRVQGIEGEEWEVVLLDWEVAGWYPSYWEYSRSMMGCGRWEDDWNVYLSKMVEPCLVEWAWADMMMRELWS